eukprot:SAG11_NODE_8295_length_1033_cov_1.123126_1_plen_28_part_10
MLGLQAQADPIEWRAVADSCIFIVKQLK